MVTEMLRQALHLSVQWGKPLYIITCDVKIAFDDILHDVMADSMLQRGVHSALSHAFLLEYPDLRGRVKFADVDPTGFFECSKAGRQGGVETQHFFNIIMEAAASELVDSWKARNFGFSLDDVNFISHAVWADNLYFFGHSFG